MLQVSGVVKWVARGWTDKVPETNRKTGRKHVMSAANPTGVVGGIDAGGSSTWARAVDRGVVVHEGIGGPGNPIAADRQALRASYGAALAGCPPRSA
jgi:hypothetical protein